MPITPDQIRAQLHEAGVDIAWCIAMYCSNITTEPRLHLEYMLSNCFEATTLPAVARMIEHAIHHHDNQYRYVFVFDISDVFVLRSGQTGRRSNDVADSIVQLVRAMMQHSQVLAQHIRTAPDQYLLYYCTGETLIPCSPVERATLIERIQA